MPELPEVETICRQLAQRLVGCVVEEVELADTAVLLNTSKEELTSQLVGRGFTRVGRRGKFLLFLLEPGEVWVTVHLGMTGQLLLQGDDAVSHPHNRLVLRLRRGQCGTREHLVFRDMRKFGRVEVSQGGPSDRLRSLGPDAWEPDPQYDPDFLASRLEGRKAPIKSLLLDQRIVAGVGNIYADEALFRAGLSPLRPGGSLSRSELEDLCEALQSVMAKAIEARGCSISDYVDTDGRAGSMQTCLAVYGRAGQTCVRCGSTLIRCVVGGRGTTYCPVCQR